MKKFKKVKDGELIDLIQRRELSLTITKATREDGEIPIFIVRNAERCFSDGIASSFDLRKALTIAYYQLEDTQKT